MYRLSYAARTHQGRIRQNNEDNYYVDGSFRRNVDQPESSCAGKADGYLMASVCDGMGGEELGELASLTAVEKLDEFCGLNGRSPAAGKDEDRLAAAPLRAGAMRYIRAANAGICGEIQKKGVRMGSTVSLLEFAADRVQAVNLGDSRIYRLRDGRLEQISTDHTAAASMIRDGILKPEEAAVHPGRHQITQYLGIFPSEMILEPASADLEVRPRDRYLICSDGLTDMVADGEICEILSRGKRPEKLAQDLVQAALSAGGRDNVTVVVVEAEEIREDFFGKLFQKLRAEAALSREMADAASSSSDANR